MPSASMFGCSHVSLTLHAEPKTSHTFKDIFLSHVALPRLGLLSLSLEAV